MRRATLYGLILVGLLVGPAVLVASPLSSTTLGYFLGGTFLALAIGGVTYLIVAGSGPGKRGPDF